MESPTLATTALTPSPAPDLPAVPNPAPTAPEPPGVMTAESHETSLPRKYHDAYRLKLAGRGVQEIADLLLVDRTTVWRYCKAVEAEAIELYSREPAFNLICRELTHLTDLEQLARTNAEATKDARARVAFLAEARRCCTARTALLTTVGIIPREPDRIFKIVADLREKPVEKSETEQAMTRKEAIEMLILTMTKGRRVT